jgi:hypothetical protein
LGLLLFFLFAAPTSPAQQQPTKHPKLSTPLVELARTVPQHTGPVAEGQRITAPLDFSVETLPKSLRDTVHTGRMHITGDGEVQVYIEVTEITDAALEQLRGLGVIIQIVGQPKPDKSKGEVLRRVPTIQALLPVTMIEQVAALPFVRYIRLPDYGHRSTGSVDSQGDSILNAAQARSLFGVDGTGVRVGVISDGIGGIFATGCTTCGPTTATPSPIQTGDLPSATGTRDSTSGFLTSVSGGIIAQSFRSGQNLEGCVSNICDPGMTVGAEGTAMLEIIHDLAPGAQLYFANFDTDLAFEQAVDWLAAHVDVAVDDIGFFTPPFDGTSDVSTNTATELNTDANPIRGYFTAVGNYTLTHWQEPWTDSGNNFTFTHCAGFDGDVQLFQATQNTNDLRSVGSSLGNTVLLQNGQTVTVSLTWDDVFTNSISQYALYLILVSNALVTPNELANLAGSGAANCAPDIGPQGAPIEELSLPNNQGVSQYVAIIIQNVNNQSPSHTFDLFVTRLGNGYNLNFYTVAGSVPAESDAGGSPVSVVSVGATDAQIDANGNAPATVIEPHSGHGPTESTPQAASRMKPDVVATDGVSVTGAGGFGAGNTLNTAACAPGQTPCYFFGTSAAAPHAAAIAALVLQSAPCLLSSSNVNTPAQARANLRNFLTSTAVPLAGVAQAVPNNIEGFGLLNALAAVEATLSTVKAGPNQVVNATGASGTTVSLSGTATDPDGCPVTLSWSGACGTATGASSTLTCPIGVNVETLTVSNGGATKGLPTSTVQITVSDFSVSAVTTTATVSAGQTANYSLSLNPQFGAFTNTVSFSCAGLPSLSSCGFSPPSTAPGASAVGFTMMVPTTVPVASLGEQPFRRTPAPVYAVWVVLLGMALTGLTRTQRTRICAGILLAILAAWLLSMYAGCGGGGSSSVQPQPGTPPGTYTVTVTGSSSSLQHSTTVTLTVR